MECKYRTGSPGTFKFTVLIETYWNVNIIILAFISSGFRVLIETYWNVNYRLLVRLWGWRLRLNRNILECKLARYTLAVNRRFSLNRNILECKCPLSKVMLSGSVVLIETYWNVNQDRLALVKDCGFCLNRNILECKLH